MKLITASIILLIFLCVPVIATTTNDATSVGNYSVVLSGTSTVAGDCLFMLSSTDATFPFNTTAQSVDPPGLFTETVSGIPLMPGGTYYFKACDPIGCGSIKSFTLNRSQVMPQTTYGTRYYKPFLAADWNFTALSEIMQDAYGTGLGSVSLFIGTFWVLFLGIMWIRSESAIPPLFVSAILSSILYFDPAFTPPSWKPVLMGLTAVAVAGILYTFYRER